MNRIAQWPTRDALLAFVALGMGTSTAVGAQDVDFKGFPDVPKTHWAYQAVTELAQKGILKGYPAEKAGGKLTFHPPAKPASPPASAAAQKAVQTRPATKPQRHGQRQL